MFALIKLFASGESIKDTTVVMVTTLLNVVAGGLFFVIVPRILGPSDYGLFSFVTSTALMLFAIANFGLDSAILRFSKSSDENYHHLIFKVYIFLGLIVSTTAIIFSNYIANFFNHSTTSNILKIAFLSTTFFLLTNYFIATLQSKGEFFKASLVNVFANVARLVILLLALYFFQVGLYFVTALFFFITIVSTAVGFILNPPKFTKIEKVKIKNLFKYSSPLAFALIISSVPYENYFLLKLAGPIAVGIYSAPLKLLTFSYQFGGNFSRVLANKLSKMEDNAEVRTFLKSTFPVLALFTFVLILTITIAEPLVNLFFGSEYQESVNVLRILSVGFIFFFLNTLPSSIILYFLGKSWVSLATTISKYLFLTLMLLWFVPTLKSEGAALSFTLAELLSLLFMTIYVYIKIKK